MTSSTARLVLVAALLAPAAAEADQIKSRLMVLLDTSGSMGFHFADPVPFCWPPGPRCNPDFPGGDGSTSYTGPNGSAVPNWSGQNAFPINIYPGKALKVGRDGQNSRLFAAKAALTDAINAYTGNIDFGLSVYDFQFCTFANPLCSTCVIGNQGYSCLYTDNAFTQLVATNWQSEGCLGPGNGGEIIVKPASGSNPKILPWVDGVEDFRDSGDGNPTWGTGGGTPVNPELRAQGNTPLAEAITAIKNTWYDPVFNAGQGTPSYDAQLNCRPYILVVETDGGQSYNGGCGADPATAVQGLYDVNVNNHVLTYVLGLSITNQGEIDQLNAMAKSGGTSSARFANSQADIEAAYADILAQSVKVEVCNGKDDNCNGLIDEGLGVYQECKAPNQCGSGVCDAGRCTCKLNADCANGYSCSGGFCQPACAVGVGACLRGGAKKCDAKGNATCCVNDGLLACTPLVAGMPGPPICKPGVDNNCNGILDVNEQACQMNPCNPLPEVCNGIDDDCDGVIDNNLTDTGKSCGLNIGVCKAGVTACVNSNNVNVEKGGVPDKGDRLICQGEARPQPVACNGCDNTCVGVIDAPTQACYDGPKGTLGVGICHGGVQRCIASMCPQQPAWGQCLGQVLPQVEVCNGLDDDCNGKVDDVPGAGAACCPSMKCGVGICVAGTQQCSGGGLQCIGGQGPRAEVCNGLDDDCDGKVDNLPNLGQPCAAANGCPGVLACDLQQMAVVCVPSQMGNCNMDCGADPRLGTACGPGQGLPLPCSPGKYVCVGNQVVCQGGRGPMTETCNCIDDDCNGKVDDMAFCPGGTACYNCSCDGPCGSGEFRCMSGFDCEDDGMACAKDGDCPPAQLCVPLTRRCSGYCVPSSCDPPCAQGLTCRGGKCVDPCMGVTCSPGYQCQLGNCIDVSCRANPAQCKACENGAGGQRCDATQVPPACVPDPCCGKSCDARTQLCDPKSGNCIGTCAGVRCPNGQRCENGTCKPDLCINVECAAGTLCDPATGTCVANTCNEIRSSCRLGQVCCASSCVPDPCGSVSCPFGSRCQVSVIDCTPDCAVPNLSPSEQDTLMSVGGGGVGLGCSLSGAGGARRGTGGGAAGAGLALLWVGGLLLRRRASRRMPAEARAAGARAALPWWTAPVLPFLLGGCNGNPICLNCGGGGNDGGLHLDLSGGPGGDLGPTGLIDFATPVPDGGDGGCSPNLVTDPNNCGSCGHVCSYPHAGGECAGGQCRMGQCMQNWYDIDKDPANGCEYPCAPTPPSKCKVDADCPWGLPCTNSLCIKVCKVNADCPARTVCDPGTGICEGEYCDKVDNNCNGQIDEGFDLTSDLANCGACNAACSPQNAVPQCAQGMCSIASCNPDGKGGRWHDVNKSAADGCEYDCPVDPPAAEVCNGIDDDCDGVIDDNLSDAGKACDDYCPPLSPCVAQGNCAFALSACKGRCCGTCTEGKTLCSGGKLACDAGQGPSLEVCNGLDDNCDGQIDEGFVLKSDPLNCGACGKACNASVNGGDGNAIWLCSAGVCAIATCKPGFGDVDKNPANGCEYACPVVPPTAEICNGKDDDCDGVVDDNLTQPNNFCGQQTLCAGAKPVCCGATGWLCNYPSVNARIEVTNVQMCQGGQKGGNLVFAEALCDGLDGNCNGMVDESFLNLGKPCQVGVGACQGQASYICDPKNAHQTSCPAVANPAAAIDELCNGIDDNCDGQVDERTPMMGFTCNNGGAHACKGWVDAAVQVGAVWVYQHEASRVDASANAAGNSSARACARSGVLPWTSVNQTQAAAACAAVKDSTGAAMRLCTAAEWSTACDLGGMGTWSFADSPNVYQSGMVDNSQTCNGFDANLGASWATGTGAKCYANQQNGKIYDMSGNVGEWTSTQVVFNKTTYYKARGGTFADYSGGLKCDFDFVVLQPGYANGDIGFRCCADHAP